ncbi:MAG: hypothetical protein IJ864_02995 [Alphaproteobacteria bacterium]|nr:hypothetical protein [Alphaproteobacteria bacterium]
MNRFAFLLLVLICCVGLFRNSLAQVLDEDAALAEQEIRPDATDQDEALFNELFSDYSEEDRDVTKVKTFDDAMDVVADSIKRTGAMNSIERRNEPLPPLEGELLVGVTKGSFHFAQNAFQQPSCSFTVTLKSKLNHHLRILALNLIYSQRTFAFIFRDVKPLGTDTHSIRTIGDICYNLTGAPDIDIHKCKIVGANDKECAERIRWQDAIVDEKSPSASAF